MDCINISKNMKNYNEIVELQTNSFPKSELFSMEQILSFAQNSNVEYKAFFEDSKLCGLVFFNTGQSLLYILYLAISDKIRSNGYGTKIINYLKTNYSDKTIVANIEKIDANSQHYEQRIRRYNFYKKNGFVKLKYYLSDDSGDYNIVATSNIINSSEYMKLISQLGFDKYNPKLLKN